MLHFLVRLACVRHAASVDSEPGSNSHLKPVVCRRVVGRLPPHPRKAWWIYLVRSLGFQPEPSSHDWHVQPSCQRTDPLPPERALSVQSRDTQVRPCLSSKLVQTTRLARPLSTRCDHRISTYFPQPGSAPKSKGLVCKLVIPNGFSREEPAFRRQWHAAYITEGL